MSPKVVVIGAGYAGVSAARALAGSTERVTVINPRAEFVERIRLHQRVRGNHPATVPLRSLLPRSAEFIHDSTTAIDADRRTVTLSGGTAVDFDYLVYAAGSRSRLDGIPGAARHAVTVGSLEDADIARQRLDRLAPGSSVTVVGGGLTGVELASELAERVDHTVRLVTSGPVAPSVSDKGRDYLRRYFRELGVDIVENVAVSEVEQSKIVLADGRVLASDLTTMTASFALPDLAATSGLDVEQDNALRVDRHLVSTSSPVIVGAGDAARISPEPLRMSCQAAIPLGAHAAQSVLRLAAGRDPKPVRPKFTGQCISLGRRSALWQGSTLRDEPRPMVLTGRVGALIKEQVCASTLRFALNPRLRWLTYNWS